MAFVQKKVDRKNRGRREGRAAVTVDRYAHPFFIAQPCVNCPRVDRFRAIPLPGPPTSPHGASAGRVRSTRPSLALADDAGLNRCRRLCYTSDMSRLYESGEDQWATNEGHGAVVRKMPTSESLPTSPRVLPFGL